MNLRLPTLALPQLDALKDAFVRVLTGPEHRRAVLAGAAAVLALGFWYLGMAQPAATRVAALKARHEAAQREIKKVESSSGEAEIKARVTRLESRVRATLERMSQDVQLVQILRQLSAHAERYQITVENIDIKTAEAAATPEVSAPKPRQGAGGATEPEKKVKPLEIRTQNLELTLHCSYEAAARFLDDLKTLPALMIIDTLKIEREASAFPNLKVLLTLKFHSIKRLPEELAKT